MPAFYIMGPQKCGTTDTFERTMRHPDVVSWMKQLFMNIIDVCVCELFNVSSV